MKKIVRRSVFGLLLVVGIVLLTWKMTPRTPMLLAHATPLTHTDNWHQGRRGNISIGAHWLSNEEILFDRYEGPQHNNRVIYKRNIRSGTEIKLDGLTNCRALLSADIVDSQCVSPDGKWFLCSSRWGECLLAEVNSPRYSLYSNKNNDYYRTLYWLADSRHWLECSHLNGKIYALLLHDTQNPHLTTKLPINKDIAKTYFESVFALDRACTVNWPKEDVTENGERQKKDAPLDRTMQVAITFVSLQSKAPSLPHYTLTVPARVNSYEFYLAPQADRVAWLVNGQSMSPLYAWLHRFLPGIKPVQLQTTTLWVSDIDGKKRHEVGQIVETGTAASEEEESEEDALLKQLMWLPDGKRLSFEYKHILYVVNAD